MDWKTAAFIVWPHCVSTNGAYDQSRKKKKDNPDSLQKSHKDEVPLRLQEKQADK